MHGHVQIGGAGAEAFKGTLLAMITAFGIARAPAASLADTMVPAVYGDVTLRGVVGGRLDACLANHVNVTDGIYLTDVFKNKDETVLWQTEFWGKWMQSAVPFWTYARSPVLRAAIDASVTNILSTQLADGYIGNYRAGCRCGAGWDVWGMKYTMLGLIHDFDGTGNRAALDAACRLADYLASQVGPGRRDLYKTGSYRGMPSCSVLEPIVGLYVRTGRKPYLDFATYVFSQLEDPADGAKLISRALAGVDVAARTPPPKDWYGWENGQKAYEMMSCYQGLVDYSFATGDRRGLDAAVAAVRNIAATEINIAGGGASGECWYHGAARQVRPFAKTMETCVLTTWIRLCGRLLEATGDPSYADQIERTFYNAYLGALSRDGSVFSQYSPLAGTRSRGEDHCRMRTNCCNANGPRGFLAFLRALLMSEGGDTAVVNFYETCRGSVALSAKGGRKVTLEMFTRYPKEGVVTLWNRTDAPLAFVLKLRIPSWSAATLVTVNGVPVSGVKAGTYLALDRTWQPGDVVELTFDMTCRARVLDDHLAFVRGPVVLARDARFHDGDVDEVVRPAVLAAPVAFTPVSGDSDDAIWMSFAALLPMGSHADNPEASKPRAVHFCDFASAGGTWTSASTYRVWLPLVLEAATSGK